MSSPTADADMMGSAPTPEVAYSVHHPNMKSPGIEHLDEEHLQTVYKFLKDMKFGVEEDLDLTQIHLRPVFKPASVLGITLLFYGALILVGIVVNAVISAVITRRKLYLTDNTHLCVLNLSLAFLMQLIVVVPLTLFVIVVHNWVLGSFICYTLPIIQDIPPYCITLTLLVLCLDRHQFIRNPEQGPLPMGWILGLLWAISFALVLPYIAYITHVDLSVLGNGLLDGAEICIISLSGTASKYIKVLFVLCYVTPVVWIMILLSRTSYHLRRHEKAQSALHREELRARTAPPHHDSLLEPLNVENPNERRSSHYTNRTRDSTVASGISSLTVATGSNGGESQSLILDIRREKRSQRFLVLVVSVYFASLLPLNVLKIVRQVVTETYDNEHDFDITYIIIVWLAFLPTVIIPWFVAHWLLIGSWRKDRFVPYLGNGNSSQQHILNGSTNGQHSRRTSHVNNPGDPVHTVPSITCTRVETHHDQATSHRRVSDHPTPGKMPKRPRARSTTIELAHKNFPAPTASHIHLDDQGLLNPTNPGQGRRKSHCGGSAANYHYYHQRQTKDLPISHLTTSPTTTTTITTKKHHSLQPQFNQKRRHSSYDVGEELPPPPPPPHKGTNV